MRNIGTECETPQTKLNAIPSISCSASLGGLNVWKTNETECDPQHIVERGLIVRRGKNMKKRKQPEACDPQHIVERGLIGGWAKNMKKIKQPETSTNKT